MNNKPITGTGKDDADIVPRIGKEAAVIVSPEKAQKCKSKLSEILQGKCTEIAVRGDDDLSELGSVSNAMAAKHGTEQTLKVSIKTICIWNVCVFYSIFLIFHSKGVLKV